MMMICLLGNDVDRLHYIQFIGIITLEEESIDVDDDDDDNGLRLFYAWLMYVIL